MTEGKRFKFACTTNGWVVLDEGIILWKDEILYLLNELHEENEKLKKENKELELKLTVEKLDQHALEHYTKQNEELQDQIMKYESHLEKPERYGFGEVCIVEIRCDDWELYERLTKIVEKELNND